MAKVIITGHLGFVGSNLMPRLPGAVGIDLKEGNDIQTCDLPDADIVIHLAAIPGVIVSVEDPLSCASTNILGTIRLLQRYKNSKFIFASSGGTIQKEIESPYGLSKFCAEEYIKLLHDNAVILRFPNVYGPNSRSVADKWLKEDITIYGDGQTYRIFAHINDVVQAIIKSMDWKPGLYTLGTDQRYKVLEIAEKVGKPIKLAPARKGEITHQDSRLENNTPNWSTTLDLMDYIEQEKSRA